MARIKRHVLFDAVHGQLGGFVVKHYKYGTVLSRIPQRGPIPPSDKQLAQQERGKAAGEYYWRVKADPALALCYEAEAKKRGWPLSALTLRDFSCPPKVYAIDLSHYSGWAGNTITVKAFDDTHVKAVEVTLRDEANSIIEHGQAVESERETGWTYSTKCNVPIHGVVTV